MLRGVVDGIDDDDFVLVWGGGIYNWFDPLTLIRGVGKVVDEHPDVKLWFMGSAHPNPGVPKMQMAHNAYRLAEELGLLGKHVFFNEGWVPYHQRQNYLLEADVGVSTHYEHLETAFSFRTRVLDYLWCSLPIIATEGDSLSLVVKERELGLTVPPEDVDAVAAAIVRLRDDREFYERCVAGIAALQPEMTWERVARADRAVLPQPAACRRRGGQAPALHLHRPHRAVEDPAALRQARRALRACRWSAAGHDPRPQLLPRAPGQVAISRWVPAPLRDAAQRPALLGWLGVGLAVRLLIAPFAVSADLLAVYWRSHLIAFHGTLFDDYLVNMGAHYVHAGWLKVVSPLLPPSEDLWTHPWWWSDSAALAPQLQRTFSLDPHAFQTLLVLKVPYLLADLGAGLLLLALLGGLAPRLVRRAWAFWMLSPIGLYATYAFGRYEMLAVVCVVAALWAVERRHPWWAATLLGVGGDDARLPAPADPGLRADRRPAAGGGSWAGRRSRWCRWALVVADQPAGRRAGRGAGHAARLPHRARRSWRSRCPVDGVGPVYVFVTALLLLYGVLLGRRAGWWGRPPETAELWLWLLVVHAAMFALATFSAHYFAWFTPFVALALARRPTWRGVLPLHLLQVARGPGDGRPAGWSGHAPRPLRAAAARRRHRRPQPARAAADAGELPVQLAGALRSAFLALMVLLAAPALRELASGAAPGPAQPPVASEPGDGQSDRAGKRRKPAGGEERLLRQAPAG